MLMRIHVLVLLLLLALLVGCERQQPTPHWDQTGYRTAEFCLQIPDRWARVTAVPIRKDPTGKSGGTLNWEDPSQRYYVVYHEWTEAGAAKVGDYRQRIRSNPASAYEDNTNVEFDGEIRSDPQDIVFVEVSVGGMDAYRGSFQDEGKRVRVLICRLPSGGLAVISLIGTIERVSEEDFNQTWNNIEAGIASEKRGGG